MRGDGRGAWGGGWLVVVALFFLACSETVSPKPTAYFIAWSQDRATNKRLCVLPFLDQSQTPGLATQVRRSVAGHLSVKNFTDTELSDIDQRLAGMGEEWRYMSPQKLGSEIGCNTLLYGEVTDAGRLYLALYSQLTVAATVQLVDATTGQTLVQESYATKFREASLPLSPLSVVPDVVKTWSNLSETQMERAIDDLARNLAQRIPDLPARPPSSSSQLTAASVAPATLSTVTPPRTETAAVSGSPNRHPPPLVEVAALSVSASAGYPTDERSPLSPTLPNTQEKYQLQVAAFRTFGDAQRVVRQLREKGHDAMVAQTSTAGRVWNRVILGPFFTKEAAYQAQSRVKQLLPFSPIVINHKGW